LKSKLSDTLEANQEMIDNYHLIKDQDQVNKVYYSQIIKNFKSASEALETTNKSFKYLKKETDELKKNKTKLQKINEDLYKDMANKNKEITDLVEKLNTTIQDYEIKIEKKEEEMWALSCRMAESELKKSPSTSNDKAGYDVESNWKDKNEVLTNEIKGLREKIMDKDSHIEELTKEVQRLNKKQYNARLKKIKIKEQKISEKINEYILDEERIEVIFICPKCLSILKEPVTLSPCGHTYCKECLETIKNENYNTLYCQECTIPVKKSYENKILNKICSEISHRHDITKTLMLTISELKENDNDSIEEKK
jgi:DNA repair exonuclease SbcCD ATPase subunit